MTYRIGIIAALAGELKPLVRGWSRQADGAFLTQRGDLAAVAIAKGIGAARATQAVAIAETYGRLDAMVSIGWAGGASCGIQPGTAYEVGETIDASSGERYSGSKAASPIKLVTLDHVAGREEKRRVAETYGASLVDMEAATIARLAEMHNIPLLCIKGVSDAFDVRLPDLNAFIDQRGQMKMPRFLAHVALRPQYWLSLLHLGGHSAHAAEAMRDLILKFMEEKNVEKLIRTGSV